MFLPWKSSVVCIPNGGGFPNIMYYRVTIEIDNCGIFTYINSFLWQSLASLLIKIDIFDKQSVLEPAALPKFSL